MPDSIERVESEGERKQSLGRELESHRPGGESGGEGGALEVPAECGRGEVGQTEEVESTGQGDSGDSVERGEVPGYLGLVDSQVGGDGAVEALFGEDLVGGFAFAHGLGCGQSR